MMDKTDKIIIKRLSIGESQIQISEHLLTKGITPNSVSMIEKRIKNIKKQYNAKTVFQLAVKLIRDGVLK